MEGKKLNKVIIRYSIIAAAGILSILLAEFFGFFEGIDNHLYGLSFRLRGNREPSDRIIIVGIDEKTLEKTGRWPIRRAYYARLLNVASESRVVIFNVFMVEPSPDDPLLADSIKKYGKIIMPVYIDGQTRQMIRPLPFHLYNTGHVHVEEEIDGVVRKAYHTIVFNGKVLPSISSVGWETYSGKTLLRKDFAQTIKGDTTSEEIIQTNPLKINFYGGTETFRYVSLIDVVDGKYPPDFFKDKIVFLGVTAAGIETRLLTPFTEKRNRMPGVEVHANILNNFLDGNCIRDVEDWTRILSCVIFSGLLFFFLFRFGENKATVFWMLSLVLITCSVFFLFAVFHRWINPAVYYFSFTFVFLTTYMLRLDEAARKLDAGYLNVASIPGWKTNITEQAIPQKGLLSILSPSDIKSRIHLITEITGRLKDSYVQISKDLEAAAQIQKNLLPTSALAVPGVNFEWFFYPSSFVAGDIFNYFYIDETHVGFYLADVSGHGVPAAMLAVTISKVLTPSHLTGETLFHCSADQPASEIATPATVMKGINRFFSTTAHSDQYFTAIYGIIDIEHHTIKLAQAGLPQPVFLTGDGDISALGDGGFPVALMDDIDYVDEIIAYKPGDRIFIYSDGIIECFNKNDVQFSIDRLMEVLREGRDVPLRTSLDNLEQALFTWRGSKEFDDDLTMLAIEFNKTAPQDSKA